MKRHILYIETSTHNCSVSVSREAEILATVEQNDEQYIHGEMLHVFALRAMEQAGISVEQLDAVAVGKGPGSYTGLRIGVSAAKGLAFGRNIPLYSLSSLKILAQAVLKQYDIQASDRILSCIDARRMEVYSAVFDAKGEWIEESQAEVVDANTYTDRMGEGNLWVVGDAQEKLREVLSDERFRFTEIRFPSASDMIPGILRRMDAGQEEDVAYFEPFYLKDFVAGKPGKKN